jgi:hypothetical protein
MKSFQLFALILLTLACTTFSQAQDGGAAAGSLQIAEAKLGTNVENRELTGEDSTFALNSKVFLWMKVTGGASDQISVIWKNGEMTHSTTLMIGGSPWRTWATKTATKAGEWSVSVTDTAGNVLKDLMFKVE